MLGEETVLLRALEGRRAQPDQRPPYPGDARPVGPADGRQQRRDAGAVPWIVANGARRSPPSATPTRPGTDARPGQRRGPQPGIVEVPTGTSLARDRAARGRRRCGRQVKAVLVGGPSGGFLPPTELDTPYAFGALREAGAHVGSGTVVVADESACIVDLAALLTRFCADEACGKTIPCRIGTRRLAEIGERFTSGRPRPTDLELLVDLCHDIVESAPVRPRAPGDATRSLSGMRYFRSELDDHIVRSTCPAGVCHPIAVGRRRSVTTEAPHDRRRDDRRSRRTTDASTPSPRRCSTTQAPQRPTATPRIRIEVDGRVVEGLEGQTILEVCRDNGIEVPTLCYEPKLPGFGACRMCVVEVEGEEHPPISCSRDCEAGMVVQTQTEEIRGCAARPTSS